MSNHARVMQLFAVPVYVGALSSVTEDIKTFCQQQIFEEMYSGTGSYTSNNYFLNLPEMQVVKEEIDSHVETYTRQVLKIDKCQQFYMTTSWVLRHDKNNYAVSHGHTNSLISGVFYLNQHDEFGDLVFEKNFDNLFPKTLEMTYTEFNPINSGKWSLSPSTNMIVLFPSNLNHSVTKNMSDESRYSVAFNYFAKGEFGRKESKLFL